MPRLSDHARPRTLAPRSSGPGTAGLIALTEVLLDEPAALADAREWLDALVANMPDRGHLTWAGALEHVVARAPGLRKDLLAPRKAH